MGSNLLCDYVSGSVNDMWQVISEALLANSCLVLNEYKSFVLLVL